MSANNLLISESRKTALRLPDNVWDIEAIKYKTHKDKVRKFNEKYPDSRFISEEDFFEIDMETGLSIYSGYDIRWVYD